MRIRLTARECRLHTVGPDGEERVYHADYRRNLRTGNNDCNTLRAMLKSALAAQAGKRNT